MPREGNDYFVLLVSYGVYDVIYILFDVHDAYNDDDYIKPNQTAQIILPWPPFTNMD